MSPYTTACIEFEKDIHAFVDHELADDGVKRLSHHLQGCEPCREYVDDLRQLASLHRQAAPLLDEAVASTVDKHELFGAITRTLLVEKRGELARLFYELGKAYVLKANEAMSGRLERAVKPVTAAMDIRTTSSRGRELAREVEGLQEAHDGRETGSLFSRSRRLFSSSARAGAGALTNGRRLLEEALKLEAGLSEARLYLGLHHMLAGRFDRARLEYRRVYREASDETHRTMALHMLGNVHAAVQDYERAIQCYEAVIESGLPDKDHRLWAALVNLGMNCAKAGRVRDAIESFTELVSRFPTRIDSTRELLKRKRDFTALLERQSSLQRDLCRHIPALFAA